MKKSLILGLTLIGLMMLGCAKKKVEKKMDITPPTYNSTNTKNSTTNTTINGGYENVDRFGGFTDSGGYSYDDGDNRYSRGYRGYDDGALNQIQNIYFGLDKYAITPDKLTIIINNAKILRRAVASGARVKVEGHCDMRGSDEYNYALGLKRAKSAKEALVSRGGIDPSKIIIVSYGESSPECTRDYSEECLAKNRRVEFKIIE